MILERETKVINKAKNLRIDSLISLFDLYNRQSLETDRLNTSRHHGLKTDKSVVYLVNNDIDNEQQSGDNTPCKLARKVLEEAEDDEVQVLRI